MHGEKKSQGEARGGWGRGERRSCLRTSPNASGGASVNGGASARYGDPSSRNGRGDGRANMKANGDVRHIDRRNDRHNAWVRWARGDAGEALQKNATD